MIHRRLGAMALVGAAAGAIVSAVLISSPMAYADPPPVPPVNPFDVFIPPGDEGFPTDIQVSSIPYLYTFHTENIPYTVFDQGQNIVGTYDIHQTGQIAGLLPEIGLVDESNVVTDSTGAAPAVGTEWDTTDLGLLYPQFVFFENMSMSSPDGTSADLFVLLDVANYFSSGPTGLLDELGFLGTWVPIIDTPT